MLFGFHFGVDEVPACVSKVGHLVKCPEGGIVAPAHHGAIAPFHGVWGTGDATVHWHINRTGSIVQAKPNDSTNWIGQPTPHLANKRKPCLLGGSCTFVAISLSINFPCERSPTVRHFKWPCTHIFAHVQFGTFQMITHKFEHILNADFTVRLHPERHAVSGIMIHVFITIGKFFPVLDISFYILPILTHVTINIVKHTPNPDFTETCATKSYRGISIRKAKIFIGAFIKTFIAGKGNYIGSINSFNRRIKNLVELI